MSTERENKLWENIRKWLGRITGRKPQVIIVIGLTKEDCQWEIDWKASHWIDDYSGSELPEGVQAAIVKEMMKDKLGDKLGDIVVNKGIPSLINAIAEKVRR